MADGDFEKTVKLTPGGAPQGQPDMDKTVKLNAPAAPAPVKLTPAQSAPGHDIAAIAALLPPEAPAKKGGALKLILGLVIVLALVGGAWYAAPALVLKQSAKTAEAGDHAKAAKMLKFVVMVRPLKQENYLAEYGKELRHSSDLAGSKAALEAALKIDPNHAMAVREMGLTAHAQGNGAAAFDFLNRAYKANPGDREVLILAAQSAFDAKNFKDALPLYQDLVKSGGTAQEYFNLGLMLKNAGKNDEAVAAYQNSLNKGGSSIGAHKMLAKISMEKGDYEKAMMHCEAEMPNAPNDMELSSMLAESALKGADHSFNKRDYKGAAGLLERGLKVQTNESDDIHYEAARAYAKMKKTKDVLNHLKQAFALNGALKKAARGDRDFTALRKNPQFQKLVR